MIRSLLSRGWRPLHIFLIIGGILWLLEIVNLFQLLGIFLVLYTITKRNRILVITDPSNEIDDECAIYKLMNTVRDADVYIMCVPGNRNVSKLQADEEAIRRVNHLRKLFNEFNIGGFWRSHLNSTFKIVTHKYFEKIHHLDWMLVIAPMWHIEETSFAHIKVDKCVFMGDRKHPKRSINCTKSIPVGNDYLLNQYNRQQMVLESVCNTIIDITTDFARSIALPYKFVSDLPSNLSNELLEKSWEQFAGRPPPHLSWSEDISKINLATSLNYLSRENRIDIENNHGSGTIPSEVLTKIKKYVEEFLRGDEGRPIPLLEDKPRYIKRLEKIAMVVYLVTNRGEYKSGNFTAGNLEFPDKCKEEWLNYIYVNNSNLTPAYDVIAWMVMCKGRLPSRDECIQMLES